MTPEQITVPKQTWDDTLAALEEARNGLDWYQSEYPESTDGSDDEAMERIDAALTAAKAVSHQKPETTPAPEDCAITAESARAMVAEMDMNDRVLAAIDAEPQAQITPHIDGTGTARGVLSAFNSMEQPLGWYCVSRDGLATQCADQRDAEMTAKSANRDWPNSAPYRAVQLCEYAHPQASEPAPEGWKLVPVEPTPEMCDAGYRYMNSPAVLFAKNAYSFYLAMLEAAPEAK